MTQQTRKKIRELEEAAEKAGGYVTPPWELQYSEDGERDFTALRRYSLKIGKPMSRFTREDYKNAGVSVP